jgi:hypothetical protein
MNRFSLDQAARRLAGRAERSFAQKDATDRILLKGAELAALIVDAGGDASDTEAALDSLDHALDEACWALVPAAEGG